MEEYVLDLRHLPADEWVEQLADPSTPLKFALFGYDTVEPSWGFRDRVLEDHLMYLVGEGEVHAEIAGDNVLLVPGSHLWMQPGVAHTFSRGPDSDELTVYFVRFRLSSVLGNAAVEGPPHLLWNDAWELRSLFEELIDELGTRLAFRDVRLRALVIAICTTALRRHRQESDRAPGTLTRAQRKVIERLLREDVGLRITPAQLATAAGLSHDYFTRLFAATFGAPPRVWLVDERLRRAAKSLADGLATVTQVAAAHGYADPTAFSHQFKQRYGVSPGTFRRLQRIRTLA